MLKPLVILQDTDRKDEFLLIPNSHQEHVFVATEYLNYRNQQSTQRRISIISK